MWRSLARLNCPFSDATQQFDRCGPEQLEAEHWTDAQLLAAVILWDIAIFHLQAESGGLDRLAERFASP
ncbi:MAG: hypothetical protein WA864_14115 [Acetobacteraceae bacterium]